MNRYFESNQCEEILNTIEKPLNINDKVISKIVDDNLKYFNIKREEYKLEFESGQKEDEKIKKEEEDKVLEKRTRKI